MAVILTPTPPVRFCINRLRQAVAEASRFPDENLLATINDGYRSACRRSRCLEALTTVTFPIGAFETMLPVDWVETKRVYQAGQALDPVDYRRVSDAAPGTYYQYGATLGLTTLEPDTETTVTLLYARLPAALGYDDEPEWGTEWNYLLRHYTAWRCILASGGAQTITKAGRQEQLFYAGVERLHQSTRKGKRAAQQRARTVAEGGAAVAG